MGRPHAHWPTGLCELDRIGQAAADAKAAGRECPLTACVGKAAALLLCDRADKSLHRSQGSFKSEGAVETELSPDERRDFIGWINSAKDPDARARRVEESCKKLATGKRHL